MKIKINEYKDIPVCHISFDKAIINYDKDTKDSYVSTLKNCTNVNINFMESSIITEIEDDEIIAVLRRLKKLDYKYAVLWAEGSWPLEPEIDEAIIKAFSTYDRWLVAGHILNFKNKEIRFHEQCIIVNLKEVDNIKWLTKDEILKKKYRVSEENIHDDYTPYWIKPIEGNNGKVEPANIFDRFLWVSLKEGYTVLNIDSDIRNKKQCVYPEDEQQWTQIHANLKYWNSLTKQNQIEFVYNLKENHQDKRPLFELLNSSHNMIYVTNTEDVPNYNSKGIEVLVCPASGLSQFKHIANNIDTMEQVIWVDFSKPQMDWLQGLIRNWNGINFKQYYENNKPSNLSLIYEESKVDEFFNSFDSEQKWLETWYKIKELEHSFIIADIIQSYDDIISIVKPNKVVFLQVSNIWSYEANYFDSGMNVYFSLIDYIHKMLNKSKKVYFSGDAGGTHKDMVDIGRRTWI